MDAFTLHQRVLADYNAYVRSFLNIADDRIRGLVVVAGARRETKRVLSEMVAHWYQDVQKPPWEQEYDMYRRFNVWGFPDDQGRPFNHIPCKIVQQTQMQLF